ncbi:MAG TPA: ribosome biogenesis GTPase YlqF [Firmicutes bacterium]|nr:ribosome biogenesis GTPase YlqF [Bacillota bacterium]
MTVQWFPGHMAKARRELQARLPQVDFVLEIADARVPAASRNPDLAELLAGKLHLLVLNKADLASPPVTTEWLRTVRGQGIEAVAFSAQLDRRQKLLQPIRKLASQAAVFNDLRVLVAGIPNVGKSAVINKLVGRRRAIVGAKPGVTRSQQWIRAGKNLIILDTPGILWPKFSDQETGYKLAAVGAIRAEILPQEEISLWLGQQLQEQAPLVLETTYDLESSDVSSILPGIAQRRGLYLSGGKLDTARAAALLLREFQQGKLGRISLERPREKETDL